MAELTFTPVEKSSSPPSDVTFTPVEGPKTTAGGVAASLARGAAPIAAGALAGAAIGGIPTLGVGAVPGAIAGGLAAGATELAGTVYNFGARHLGGTEVETPKGATDRALDVMGIKRPSTGIEHGAEMLGGMVPLGVGSTKGAADLGAMIIEHRTQGPERIEKWVENAYDKAVRPTVVGKGTGPKIEEAEKNVLRGISSIIENKDNLRLAGQTSILNKMGREVVGRLPRTLDEFVQAIAQTKRPVFDKYDTLARQAEGMGARIDTTEAVNELRRFASDPSFNLPKFQEMRAYALENAEVLERDGQMLPTVAQSTIRNLNEGLSSFYRASSPQAAGKAAVDDLIANKLRSGMDSTLERAGLPGWQEARNEYGALKAIESEVAHRAVVYGRSDPGGGVMGRLGSIASYEELARFAVRHDPAALASAVAIKGGQKLTEYVHGPNRAVKRMFEKMEKLREQKGPLPPTASGGAPVPVAGGMQPPRPTGPGQYAGGGTSTGVASGGAASQTMGITPRGAMPIESDPFLTPPGGGRVQ